MRTVRHRGQVVAMTATAFDPDRVARFRYCGVDIDATAGTVVCHYALDDLTFDEHVTVHSPDRSGAADPDAFTAAARLVYLLAGVSYFKAAAPPEIIVDTALTDEERSLLEVFYLDGLGEYAFRNGLDLSAVRIVADHASPTLPNPDCGQGIRPLIPFGGGIDSIVTVQGVRQSMPTADIALFVMSRAGDRFDAIESAAAVTGLRIVRAERRIDDKILQSAELGFRNGHVPVTGVLSAVAVLAAAYDGCDSVVMSNEWSASLGNLTHLGRDVNHQWSKSLTFENLFRSVLAQSPDLDIDYYSWLRCFSELWVAQRFADMTEFHPVFRSCNRSFHLDRAVRLDHWCGTCDKCCFIDLILAPFMAATDLAAVFDGVEPLDNPDLVDTFRALAGLSNDAKPFECVGDVDECRVAVLLAAARPDRHANHLLATLATETAAVVPGDVAVHAASLLKPLGTHNIPSHHAPVDLLG